MTRKDGNLLSAASPDNGGAGSEASTVPFAAEEGEDSPLLEGTELLRSHAKSRTDNPMQSAISTFLRFIGDVIVEWMVEVFFAERYLGGNFFSKIAG